MPMSSLTIVPVAFDRPSVAFTGFDSETVNDSSGSIAVSARTGTATVADVCPAGIEAVVDTAV